jgi:hypothetical protein
MPPQVAISRGEEGMVISTIKRSATLVAAISFLSVSVAPALAFVSADGPVPALQADVMPTQSEVQAQLSSVGEQLREDELASVSATNAQADYQAAEHSYQLGRYWDAYNQAVAAEHELPQTPNWIDGHYAVR